MDVDNLKGKVFRGYQLRDLIGVGGFGVVYRAYQPVVEREVAIKIILPEYASRPDFIRNFEREAHLVARLEHPHIVPLYDYWRDPNGAFIVMRWIRGGSLQDAIKNKGALDLQMTAKVLDQIADALAEAHRNNVVHQDIKAANILLDEQGNAYLTDFGIAKDLSRAKETEEENGAKKEIHGSPEYMAPEQILNLVVDARTDIYSLGVVVYEMLTGDKPFLAPSDEELVRRQLYEKIPALQRQRPDLSPNFDLVIQRATDKNPKRRYTSPVAMAENFRQFVSLMLNPQPVETSSSPAVPIQVVAAEAEPAKKLDPVNPYKGLQAFQEADANDFFGREKLIERLYLRMLEPGVEARFLAIIGPSGSGKSSVARAGLVPKLKANLPRWFFADMTPGANPIQQLVDALLTVAVDSSVNYVMLIRSGIDGLHQAVTRGLGQVQGQRKHELVLLIDQFEELFTLLNDELERKFFIDSLLYAINAEDSQLRVIVTLRADFYDRPLAYPGLSELFNRRHEALSPMTTEDLIRAIEKPAERVGLEIDENLVGEIIAEVGAQSAPLPLLQYALTELFAQRIGAKLTAKAYRASGGVSGAMTRRADDVYQSLSEPEKLIAQQLFLRLVTPGEGTEDTRRRVIQSELGKQVEQQRVINEFGKYRLLSFDREPETREATVEIAHEVLIRNWQLLKKWLNDNRDALRLQRQLAEATSQWLNGARDSSYLADGARLAGFEGLPEVKSIVLGANEHEFLAASIEKRKAAVRRQQQAQAVVVMVAVVMSFLAIFALYQRGQAEQARDDVVVAQSTTVAERDRADVASKISQSNELAIRALTGSSNTDQKLLLAVEASEVADTFEARDALLTTIQGVPRLERFLHGNTDAVRATAYSPDGRWIASGGRDNTLRLWDVSTGQPYGEPMAHPDLVNAVMFSPDSQQLVTGSSDGKLRWWEVTTGQLIREQLLAESEAVWRVAYSPDGRVVAATEANGMLWRLDATTGEPVGEAIQAHGNDAYGLAYSLDGTLIATGGEDRLIRLWDAATGEMQGELTGHTNWVWALAFSSDVLASVDFDGNLRLWDVATMQAVGEAIQAHTGNLRGLTFDSTGQRLVTGGDDGFIKIWAVAQQQLLAVLTSERSSPVWSVALSPDGAVLVTANDTSMLQVWTLRRGSLLGQTLTGQTQPIGAITFTADGGEVIAIGNDLTSTTALNTAGRWSTTTFAAFDLLEFARPEARLTTAMTVSPDGTLLVTADQTGKVVFNAMATGEVVGESLLAHAGTIFAVTLSADGQRLATGDAQGVIKIWQRSSADALTWEAVGEPLTGHLDRILTLAFSPDGRYLASGSRDNTVLLWQLHDDTTSSQLLTGHGEAVVSLAFSPDSLMLASGGRDNRIILWDSASGELRQTLTAHLDWVNVLAFSPDGHYLASGSKDQTMLLWDTTQAAARQMGEPFGGAAAVSTLNFSPDSRMVAFASENGAVQVWHIQTDFWKQTACNIANRNFSGVEWLNYLRDTPYRKTCPDLE